MSYKFYIPYNATTGEISHGIWTSTPPASPPYLEFTEQEGAPVISGKKVNLTSLTLEDDPVIMTAMAQAHTMDALSVNDVETIRSLRETVLALAALAAPSLDVSTLQGKEDAAASLRDDL